VFQNPKFKFFSFFLRVEKKKKKKKKKKKRKKKKKKIDEMTSSGIELRIGNKYRVGRKIGSGSFGDIYLGRVTSFLFLSFCFLSPLSSWSTK
jgi:hypothetical protein